MNRFIFAREQGFHSAAKPGLPFGNPESLVNVLKGYHSISSVTDGGNIGLCLPMIIQLCIAD
jgi:hypothetical protein